MNVILDIMYWGIVRQKKGISFGDGLVYWVGLINPTPDCVTVNITECYGS